MNQIKTQYKSQGVAPDGSPFLTVKQSRGYYEYSERPGMDSIAFILYDFNENLFGLIHESKPSLDERMNELAMMTTAFGGSIDVDLPYREICQKEVLEEAGYQVPLNRIYSIGTTLVSTQMSQLCEGFLVDITGISKTHLAEYETSDDIEFSRNRVVWMTDVDLLKNSDWKSIWIVARAHYKGLV